MTAQVTLKANERLALLRTVTNDRRRRTDREVAKQAIDVGVTVNDAIAELHRRQCRNSLAAFTKAMWHVVEPATPLVWNWHIDKICEALEKVSSGEILRLLINVPPGHMKSLLCSVMWPAWNWLRDPAWKVICASYGAKLSIRDARKCRALIRSTEYTDLIPGIYGERYDAKWDLKGDSKAVEFYETEYGGGRLSTSPTGVGTGFRGHCLMIDDPMNMEEHPTDALLQSVVDWYDGRMSERFNNMATGAIVIIMQRLHEYDLAGHIIAQDEVQKDNPDWLPFTVIKYPSEYEPETADPTDIRTERGELLFPARFPRHVIERSKIKLGPRNYSAQHCQTPIVASGGLLSVNRLCYHYPADVKIPPPAVCYRNEKGETIPCRQGPLPTKFDVMAQSWDCAFKDAEANDHVAGQLWGRVAANLYLIEEVCAHLGIRRTIEEIKAMRERCPRAFSIYIEDKANGSAVIEMLKDAIFGIEAVEPKGGKIARANASDPIIHAQNVWLPHPHYCSWTKDFVHELTVFPLGRRDDRVDAMTQLIIEFCLKGQNYLRGITRQ